MSMEQSDRDAAAVSKGPRISLKDIENEIESIFFINGEHVVVHADFAQNAGKAGGVREAASLLTVCLLVTKDGFTVLGKSACAAPENYDEKLGRKLAYDDCLRQMWPLMGFRLKSLLATQTRHG